MKIINLKRQDQDKKVVKISKYVNCQKAKFSWIKLLPKGRVPKLKSAKVWSLTIEGGGRPKPNPYSELKTDFKL